MFTGIIDHCGIITKIDISAHNSRRIWINSNFTQLILGESIAINGICLTVMDSVDNVFSCDISPETLNVTTASQFKVSEPVNLERAMQLSSRIGGHLVAGHVDQVCYVKSIHKEDQFTEIVFAGITEPNMCFVSKKGSIAINGVSLTINDLSKNGFSVMLIPHTLLLTNLSHLSENDEVNIEFDMLAKIIIDQCQRYFTTHSNSPKSMI